MPVTPHQATERVVDLLTSLSWSRITTLRQTRALVAVLALELAGGCANEGGPKKDVPATTRHPTGTPTPTAAHERPMALRREGQGLLDSARVALSGGDAGLAATLLELGASFLVKHACEPARRSPSLTRMLLLRRESAWLADASEPRFRRVLVPLDGSSVAGGILDHVLSLATPGVTVSVILMVVAPLLPVDLPYTETPVFGAPFDEDDQRAAAMSYLGTVAEELRTGEALVEVLVITHEHAAHAILDAAHEQHVDLIALSRATTRMASSPMCGASASRRTSPPTFMHAVRGVACGTRPKRPSRTPRWGPRRSQ